MLGHGFASPTSIPSRIWILGALIGALAWAAPAESAITIGPGPALGTDRAGVTWYQDFQDWTHSDLRALDDAGLGDAVYHLRRRLRRLAGPDRVLLPGGGRLPLLPRRPLRPRPGGRAEQPQPLRRHRLAHRRPGLAPRLPRCPDRHAVGGVSGRLPERNDARLELQPLGRELQRPLRRLCRRLLQLADRRGRVRHPARQAHRPGLGRNERPSLPGLHDEGQHRDLVQRGRALQRHHRQHRGRRPRLLGRRAQREHLLHRQRRARLLRLHRPRQPVGEPGRGHRRAHLRSAVQHRHLRRHRVPAHPRHARDLQGPAQHPSQRNPDHRLQLGHPADRRGGSAGRPGVPRAHPRLRGRRSVAEPGFAHRRGARRAHHALLRRGR